MKSLGRLTGCAPALACAHEGKSVVGDTGTNMKGTVAGEASQAQAPSTADAATAAIRPFHVNVPEKALVDLRQRIAATGLPDRETVTDRSQGAQLAKIQALVRYWGTYYDWRKAEAKLNALPQFVTKIDGLDIHRCHYSLSRRDLSRAPELGRAGSSQADLFPRGRQGRALRGLGTAGTLRCGDPSGVQVTVASGRKSGGALIGERQHTGTERVPAFRCPTRHPSI